MESEEIHALLTVVADGIEEDIGGDVRGISGTPYSLVYRHGADYGVKFENLRADFDEVAAGGEVHDGIGTLFEGTACFSDFEVGVAACSRGAYIDIDFYA